jgi:hypothetical protein
MPVKSAREYLDPARKEQLEQKLDFIRRNRSRYPGFVRSVAEASGYTPANIYSVLNGLSFNIKVIEEAYAQVCRCMGVLDEDTAPETGNPDDDKALSYLSRCRQLRLDLEQNLKDARDLALIIKRRNKDLRVLDGTLELHLQFNLEDMSDMIATQAKEYLRSNYDRPVHEPPSNAVDVEEISPDILAAMATLHLSGALTPQGFLKDDNEVEEEIGIGVNITDLLPDPV